MIQELFLHIANFQIDPASLGVVRDVSRRPFTRSVLIASPLSLYPYCQLPLFLPIISLIEAFITSTSQASHSRGNSFTSSSCSIGKAPAVPKKPKKQARQSSQSQKRKHQKTKPDKAPAEPLTYHKVKSNLKPEPAASQASK